MIKIQILGTGCPKCKQLAENAEIAAKTLGLEYELEKVSEINEIMKFGVMLTPGLAVDGVVKVTRKVSKPDRQRRVAEALEMVQMDDRADARTNELSGGQQQRIALARALVIQPRCLLLDEPLSNLDAKLRLEMRTEIRRICKQAGLTAVYVTHDQSEALSVSDRLAVMRDGRIAQAGTPLDVYRAPADDFVARFIGETNLIPARALHGDANATTFETPHGSLIAPGNYPPGTQMVLNIRPEALRLESPPPDVLNVLTGSLCNSIYLGQTAQHEFHPADLQSPPLKVLEINPRTVATAKRTAHVWIDPADIALLPAH